MNWPRRINLEFLRKQVYASLAKTEANLNSDAIFATTVKLNFDFLTQCGTSCQLKREKFPRFLGVENWLDLEPPTSLLLLLSLSQQRIPTTLTYI